MDEKKSSLPEPSHDGYTGATKPRHKPLHIAAIIAACVGFALTATFNALSSGAGQKFGLFISSTGNVSDKYYLEITPAGWTFTIWGFIYAYQVMFLGYGVSTIFRRSPDGDGYLYYQPGHMHIAIYLIYCLNMAFNITWVFLWDREQLVPAVIFIALIFLSLYVCIFFTARGLSRYGEIFVKSCRMYEIALVRYLAQNGLAMYATWVTIATLLNLGSVLTYWGGIPQDVSSTAMLSVLLVETLVYWVLDNVVFDRHLRYLWTPYIVLHVALIGSITGNWDPSKRNCIFSLVILALGFSLTVTKIILVIYRWRKKPIFECKSSSKVDLAPQDNA